MAKIVFGMNQSLDGYVDHDHQEFAPSPALFRHFIEQVRGLAGSVYGRQAAHLLDEVTKERGTWRKFLMVMVDVAVQGLVHSKYDLRHSAIPC